ncbi:MAG TPA: hypothetical protein VFB58_02955 [Chloroflexota bacterium]|nr:hypothetical protein [Chloroflexota bacterium]
MSTAAGHARSRRDRAAMKQGNIITPERAAAMDRARERLTRGRTFAGSSAELIREARDERWQDAELPTQP